MLILVKIAPIVVEKKIFKIARAPNGKIGPVHLSKKVKMIEKVLKSDYSANGTLLMLCLWL